MKVKVKGIRFIVLYSHKVIHLYPIPTTHTREIHPMRIVMIFLIFESITPCLCLNPPFSLSLSLSLST